MAIRDRLRRLQVKAEDLSSSSETLESILVAVLYEVKSGGRQTAYATRTDAPEKEVAGYYPREKTW